MSKSPGFERKRKKLNIFRDDQLEAAGSMNIKKTGSIISEIIDIAGSREKYAEKFKVQKKLREKISETFIIY
jgi:hypothetical protein